MSTTAIGTVIDVLTARLHRPDQPHRYHHPHLWLPPASSIHEAAKTDRPAFLEKALET